MNRYILQNDFSSDFKTELIDKASNKIFQGIKNKQLDDNNWYWEVDLDKVDIYEIHEGIINKEKERFINMINIDEYEDFIECENFNELHELVAKDVQLGDTKYKVVGDIVNRYAPANGNYIKFDFLDEHKKNQSLTLIVDNKTNVRTKMGKKIKWSEIDNCRVKTYITYEFNTMTAKVSLRARAIDVLGPCSREAEYDDLYVKYKNIIKDERPNLVIEADNPKIALISGNSKNHGRADFMYRIRNDLCDITAISANMSNIADIVDKIQKVNHDSNADVICIVRGGGDAEDMCIYNSVELIEAILHSTIPIVTGIGHQNDNLIIKKITYGNATPTAAADYLNKIMYQGNNGKKPSYRELSNAYNNLQCAYNELSKKYEDLQEEAKKKKKGIFARLFGF